jgi:hypothetical protein
VTLQRDIEWGDQVIHAGASAVGRTKSYYLSGVYRFAAYKNDRFELGPALGRRLPLDRGRDLRTGQHHDALGRDGDAAVRRLEEPGQPTGDLGAYFYWWPARRLLVRGDLRYIIVKPGESEASVTDGRGGLIYHVTRPRRPGPPVHLHEVPLRP